MNAITIGRYSTSILFFVFIVLHDVCSGIQLQITDLQSRPLSQVGINQQFLIHFRAENVSSQVEPIIPGIEIIHVS